MIQQSDKARISEGVIDFGQQDAAALALDQGTHSAGVTVTLDQIALPVAGDLATLDLDRSVMDRDHVAQASAPVLAAAAGQARLVGLAQGPDQQLAQFPAGLGVDVGVDGLVADPFGGFLGMHLRESPGDLLRRPASPQPGVDHLLQGRPWDELACASPTVSAGLLSGPDSVVARAATAPGLAADGAWRAVQTPSQGPSTQPAVQARLDVVSLLDRQVVVSIAHVLTLPSSLGVALQV